MPPNCKLSRGECAKYCKHDQGSDCPNFLPAADKVVTGPLLEKNVIDSHLDIVTEETKVNLPKSNILVTDHAGQPVSHKLFYEGYGEVEGLCLTCGHNLEEACGKYADVPKKACEHFTKQVEGEGPKKEKILKSGEKRDVDANYKVGPGNPPKDKQFTSDNQPPGSAKAKGWQKKKFSRDMIRTMLDLPINCPEDLKKEVVAYYGEGILESLTAGQLIVFQQMRKALESKDTNAANFVTEHGIGRPVQGVAQADMNGNDLPKVFLGVPIGLDISLPDNTEGDDKKQHDEAE